MAGLWVVLKAMAGLMGVSKDRRPGGGDSGAGGGAGEGLHWWLPGEGEDTDGTTAEVDAAVKEPAPA